MEDYRDADGQHMSRRWRRSDGPFQRCRSALERRLNGEILSIGEQGYVMLVVDRRAAKYGSGSDRDAYRTEQARQNVKVWLDALAEVLIKRVADLEDNAGIDDIEATTAPIAQNESRPGARIGADLPATFARKVRSARIAPIADLIADGQISSPEVLAVVLPQITANVHASGLTNRAERAVFSSLYRSFQRRRSLLLLDLQSQVRLEELPWGQALVERRESSLKDAVVAREVLNEIAGLSLTYFPHVQLPNSLIDEMEHLAQTAQIDAPFTREIAADIFTGRFTKTFERAAKIAISRYARTLYGRYYELPEELPRVDLGGPTAKRERVVDTATGPLQAMD